LYEDIGSILVGGLEHFFIFPNILGIIITTDFIFFGAVETTNQYHSSAP
jgi:hypothetical protein